LLKIGKLEIGSVRRGGGGAQGGGVFEAGLLKKLFNGDLVQRRHIGGIARARRSATGRSIGGGRSIAGGRRVTGRRGKRIGGSVCRDGNFFCFVDDGTVGNGGRRGD